jgi:UDP-N-acetylmuramate: L-alanyl-gamma-D-glutamyl-meso-diaminopimelate ligase
MPQALNHFVAADKRIILVTGTHGKTTTASLAAWMLHACGFDPTFFVGGILQNFDTNYRLGKGPYMVIEGDEYDTAFFDKGPKFRHYPPAFAVLTGVEFDHADIFADVTHIERFFDPFLAALPPNAALAVFDGNERGVKLSRNRHCRVMHYGGAPTSEWQLGEVTISPPWTRFAVVHQGTRFATFKTRMIGRHNLHNALAAIAMAHDLGISRNSIADALARFINTRRRQEVRGIKSGITVIDDFAHHPTAVRETVNAVKDFYRGQRIIAVFEPRTNTSMRDVFQTVYPNALAPADVICVREPPLLKKIPQGQRFSSTQLVNDLSAMGRSAHYFPDTSAILSFLRNQARSGDVVLIMSNGGFDNIHQRLLASL